MRPHLIVFAVVSVPATKRSSVDITMFSSWNVEPSLDFCCSKWNKSISLLFVINNYFYFFSHTTQHNIQNRTKQNSRHILNISRFNQKGWREGRTTRTQKSLLYIITYIQQKNTAKTQWSKAWPHRLVPLYIHMRQFAGGYGSNTFFYTCVV